MNTTVWDVDFVYKGPMAVKVSCHAGDLGQRVICNAIGDQPLFYVDDAQEDDDLLDYMTDTALEEMQAKLQIYDRAIECLSNIKTQSTDIRFENEVLSKNKTHTSVNDVLDFGRKSGLFAGYLDFAQKHEIKFKFSTEVETAFFNKEKATILLNPSLDIINGAKALIKSLRTVWNYKQGILINPLTFQPEETVLINRLFSADLDITLISFIWDLKLAGHEDIWNDAMNGSDYDLYTAYAVEAMADFRSIKSGLAARATFEKWFISDRCKNYDRQIIQVMLANYAAHEIDNSTTSRMIAMDIITRLGSRPQGKNYLSAIVPTIVSDSIYSEVRDRSNANFLWFVSFERRMAKMEQELHSEDVISESPSGINSSKDNIHELPIVHGTSDTHKGDDSVATLFFLDHFRAG